MSDIHSIISFDCGNRSLAFTVAAEKDKTEVYSFHAVDLAKGKLLKETNVHERTLRLKAVLTMIDKFNPTTVLIEHQPTFNNKSSTIQDQILYHYTGICPVELVSPSLKNAYHYTDDLRMEAFISKSKSQTNYSANKAHSRENFKYWMRTSGCAYTLHGDYKKRINDIADSFMQLQAWGKKMRFPDKRTEKREEKINVRSPDKEIDDLVEKLKDPAFAKELDELVIEQPETSINTL